MDYDSDETSAEFLIQQFPLADVLAFVNARDEVRRICALRVEIDGVEPRTSPTLRAAGNVQVAVYEAPVVTSQTVPAVPALVRKVA